MSGLTGWQSVILGLGAASITGTIALVGHVITRRNAMENQRLLKQQHDNTTVEWARQHDQWRADYDVLQKRWLREQTFTLIDQAVTRALAREDDRQSRVGIAQLRALKGSDLLQDEDIPLLEAVISAVLGESKQDVAANPDAQVLVTDAGGPAAE